jgi:uncharacterized tellurite resistance protein B-like protein
MLARLKKIISSLDGSDQSRTATDFEDHKIAAAALLVNAAMIDGVLAPSEEHKLDILLRERFGLDEQQSRQLLELAWREEEQAVDLYGFTRRIAHVLDEKDRLGIIEMMWEIAFADGVLHEFEENLIWRVAELLHVPSRERIRLRRLVRERSEKS